MLGSFIKKQFIDVIHWPNPSEEDLVWRFPVADEEIQNGASLTVRETQAALFVDEGKTADVFAPGRYTLNTQTLPVLTNLKNWDKLFQSPFKSDVYFFNMRQQLARRWGTAQPITIRDKEFGAVQVRAFGMFAYRIQDPALFFREVCGVVTHYTGEELEAQLRNLALTRLATTLGESDVPFLDMAANQAALSELMAQQLTEQWAKWGVKLENFTVESITLPESLKKVLDDRIAMGIVGDLTQYTRYQTAKSIPLAAENEGGLAGIGAGMGAGVSIGQTMAAAMQAAAPAPAAGGAAPISGSPDPQAKLTQLKQLLDQGLISQEDYDTAKAAVLKQLIG